MGFAREVPPEALPASCSGGGWHLATHILPMGLINSVAIAQHVHRRVIGLALRGEKALASGYQELRRDPGFPTADHLYRVYLDNYDELRKVDRRLADTLAGTPSDWTLAVRQTYEDLGLPRHPKKARAEVQGAWLDGEAGTAAPKGAKVVKYVRLACELLIRGCATQKELQIVGGGFVYLAMFRRPLLAGLNALWTRIIDLGEMPKRREQLGEVVELELVRFIALTPLAVIDFRTMISEEVTASDASTSGGGLCVNKELYTEWLQPELRLGEIYSPKMRLVVSLFDGIGALRVAVDALRVPVAGYVSAEISEDARRAEGWSKAGSQMCGASRTSKTSTKTRSAVGASCIQVCVLSSSAPAHRVKVSQV